jgi:hypothetical protein
MQNNATLAIDVDMTIFMGSPLNGLTPCTGRLAVDYLPGTALQPSAPFEPTGDPCMVNAGTAVTAGRHTVSFAHPSTREPDYGLGGIALLLFEPRTVALDSLAEISALPFLIQRFDGRRQLNNTQSFARKKRRRAPRVGDRAPPMANSCRLQHGGWDIRRDWLAIRILALAGQVCDSTPFNPDARLLTLFTLFRLFLLCFDIHDPAETQSSLTSTSRSHTPSNS